jgi:hypothetical protein
MNVMNLIRWCFIAPHSRLMLRGRSTARPLRMNDHFGSSHGDDDVFADNFAALNFVYDVASHDHGALD